MGNVQESRELSTGHTPTALSDIRTHRNRCPTHLRDQPISFAVRKVSGVAIDLETEVVGLLPHPQRTKVLHWFRVHAESWGVDIEGAPEGS